MITDTDSALKCISVVGRDGSKTGDTPKISNFMCGLSGTSQPCFMSYQWRQIHTGVGLGGNRGKGKKGKRG